MLKTETFTLYQVKNGQTLSEIAAYFSVSERAVVKLNHLQTPPNVGQLLFIPKSTGNAYVVREGDTKTLLCGSEENYRQKNATDIFYIGMRVIL